MKIDINKDFEKQYKNELWKGFTARELTYAGVALFVAGAIAFGVWKVTGLAINISIYAGIPFMAPIVYLAMVQHQGHTWTEYLKNIWFYLQTKELPCEMEERNSSSYRVFSTNTKIIKEPKKKRERRKK
ncbi:MAG: PrgI family protein [[Ruminococcus] faecis]|mgnify:CR=1 FL=1|nr:PrgI family protein [Mediterraneibacter faecis]RGI18203.1 PrgI family protein [Ruminococcus sp. TF08-4]